VGVEDEIRGIVREINQAWLSRRPEHLARWLHEEVVIAPPGFHDRVRGRRAAVGSYQEFAAAATVHAADFDEADVQAWGDVAVATCRFALDYEMGGERSQDAGGMCWCSAGPRPAGRWCGAR
jgi:ketosteroid isomerase-like protein